MQMSALGSLPDTTTGTGFQLLTNTQWQVFARNAEQVPANWSGNAVGSGKLSRGHTDTLVSTNELTNSWCFGCTTTSPRGAPSSHSDANVYFGTGDTAAAAWNMLGAGPPSGTEQRRTQILSNGAVVWDLGGNVWQLVEDDRGSLGIPTADDTGGGGLSVNTNTMLSFLNGAANRFSETTNLIFGSFGIAGAPRTQFAEAQNAGFMIAGSGGILFRGASFYDGSFANGGMFSAYLHGLPSDIFPNVGFRCAFIP